MHIDDRCPLLLLSPLGTSVTAFAPIIGPLSFEQPVIVHEHRGRGLAPRHPGPLTIADLGGGAARTLDRNGCGRALVCGFALGGMVALGLAAHRADRAAGLCAACSSAATGNSAAYQRRPAAIRGRGLGELSDETVTAWVTRERAAAHPPLTARLAAMVASVDPDSSAACCGAIARFDLTPDLTGIFVPTLVISASDDRGLPPHHSVALSDAIAGVGYVEIAGTAHLAWLEQPDGVVAALRDHLHGDLALLDYAQTRRET